jgi:16S rRNA C967 or C1407 C5-methylase (RsmB/RsmF family)
MSSDSTVLLDNIIAQIDDLFAEEIGPVAAILCPEAKEAWTARVEKQGKRLGLRNIYVYVNHLASSLDNPKDKQRFTDAVYDIEMLRFLKNQQ